MATTRQTTLLIGGKDFDGNLRPLPVHYNGTLIVEPHGSAVSRGRFPNEYNFSQSGYVGTSSTTRTIIRATAYTEQASGAQRSIVSTNANDTAAGTGARTVRIRYFKNDGIGPWLETITLNGTTPVNTVNTDIRFIESMEVLTVGSNGTNVGTINLKATTAGAGATFGSIAPGDNKTFWGHHYVGTGKIGYLNRIIAAAANINYNVTVLAQQPLVTNSAEVQVLGTIRVGTNTTQAIYLDDRPIVFSGMTRITCYAVASANTAGVIHVDLMFGDVELT